MRKAIPGKSVFARCLFLTSIMVAASAGVAAAQELKHYDSTGKNFWQNPPPDWFLGDETSEQKGLAPSASPALPASEEELQANLKNVKLPPGFTISVYASGLPEARQMAWGDKGTLFVGSFGATNVYAVIEENGRKTVKTILTGLKMPTGVAFRDGALYAIPLRELT